MRTNIGCCGGDYNISTCFTDMLLQERGIQKNAWIGLACKYWKKAATRNQRSEEKGNTKQVPDPMPKKIRQVKSKTMGKCGPSEEERHPIIFSPNPLMFNEGTNSINVQHAERGQCIFREKSLPPSSGLEQMLLKSQ